MNTLSTLKVLSINEVRALTNEQLENYKEQVMEVSIYTIESNELRDYLYAINTIDTIEEDEFQHIEFCLISYKHDM